MHTRYAYIPATTFVALTRAAIGADASAIFTPHFLRHFVNRCFTDAARRHRAHLLWSAASHFRAELAYPQPFHSHSVVPFSFRRMGM